MRVRGWFALALCLCALAACATMPPRSDARTLPHLRAHGDASQLVVDEAPFLMLAGELGNSTASDLDYMRPHWRRLETLHLNTVLAPVYWELVEPEEGRFDFSLVEGLIEDARAHDMRLVLLWFGSWKNSMSSYAPAWVKRDQARFPRSQTSDGRGLEILSPFSAANRDADARAFAALMRRLREFDGARHTVLMIQVENEIGMIPESRDQSAVADARFADQVPAALMDHLSSHRQTLSPALRARWEANGARMRGRWEEVFGPGLATDEIFMAWHFAAYTEAVTAAGKAEYGLPMFVNAALIRPGRRPGEYPSAGPLPQVFDVWRAGAPSIDFLAPDIYFPNFVEWARAYDVPDNPYFIPETGRQPAATPANAFYAFGAHDAMGFSPFAIEDFAEDDPLGDAYEILRELSPLILQHQGTPTIAGVRPIVSFDGAVNETPQDVRLGEYTLHVSFVESFTPRDQQNVAAHGGLIIQLGPQEYLVAGRGLTVTFAADEGLVGIESIWEGRYVDGVWKPGRLLNGDQSHQGRHLRLPSREFGIQRVRLYRYS
jgi:beta-galactosidase GanA